MFKPVPMGPVLSTHPLSRLNRWRMLFSLAQRIIHWAIMKLLFNSYREWQRFFPSLTHQNRSFYIMIHISKSSVRCFVIKIAHISIHICGVFYNKGPACMGRWVKELMYLSYWSFLTVSRLDTTRQEVPVDSLKVALHESCRKTGRGQNKPMLYQQSNPSHNASQISYK